MANWANVARLGHPLAQGWQAENLTDIEAGGQNWRVHKQAAPAFEGLLKDLIARGYTPTSSGGFNYRNIRGSDKLSQHAFGTAIDINAATNALGSRQTDIPDAAALAQKYGLEWGGNWKSRPDPMHFEWAGGELPAGAVSQQAPEQVAQSQPMSLTEEPSGPSSFMQNVFAPESDQDWLRNESYSLDSVLGDWFSGRSPFRRLAYQTLLKVLS